MRRPLLLFLPLLLAGCFDLDSFVHNPRHCSIVDASTCEGHDPWDAICVPCETDYDWTRDYPWMEGTLAEGETIRPIDPTTVVQETVATEDGLGQLDTYFVPSHGEVAALADTTIVYNHGNYASIEHYLPRLRYLHEAGYNLFVWDYRGYGKSLPETTPDSETFLADARQIRQHIKGVVPDATKVIVYANSLGGIPATEMAVTDPGCALFLEAAFSSLSAIAHSSTGVGIGEGFLSQGRYDNIHKLDGFDGPVLFMIGDEDNKFPLSHAERLMKGVEGPKELWVLPGVKHGISNVGVPEDGFDAYRDKMTGFLGEKAAACLSQ